MKINILSIYMIVIALAGWSCSDRGNGEQGDPDSSDSEGSAIDNIAVVELTDEEMAAFCGDLYDATMDKMMGFYNTSTEEACMLAGAVAAEMTYSQGVTGQALSLACELAMRTCGTGDVDTLMAMTSATGFPASEGDFCVGVQDMFDGCTATTVEMSNCYLAFVDAELDSVAESAAELPTCDTYTAEYFDASSVLETSTSGSNLNLPLPCLSLGLKCPQLATSLTTFL